MDEKRRELVEAAEARAHRGTTADLVRLPSDVVALCAIIREQAAQLELLASATKVAAGETLIFVADKGMTNEGRKAVFEALCEVHQSPVILLPHGWSTLPVDELRAALERAEGDNGCSLDT